MPPNKNTQTSEVNRQPDTFSLWQASVAQHIEASQGKRVSNLPTRRCGAQATLFAVPTKQLKIKRLKTNPKADSILPQSTAKEAMRTPSSSRSAVQHIIASKTKQVQKNNSEAIQKTWAVFLPFLKRKRALLRANKDATFTMEDFKFEIARSHPEAYALTCQSNGFWGAFTHSVKAFIEPQGYTRSKSPASRHILRIYRPNMFE